MEFCIRIRYSGSDGLDPIFVQLDELLVVGGDLIVFIAYPCSTLYFDIHYHAYVVETKTQRVFISHLADPNVLHGRTVDGLWYVALKMVCCTKVLFCIIDNDFFGIIFIAIG